MLGALSPAERSSYERHLRSCAICRKEVADFAGLPGLLGRLDAKSAIGLTEAPKAPPMLETVLDRARTERHRARRRTVRRRAGMAVAACVLALLTGLGVGAVTGTAGGAHRATVVTMSPVTKDTHLAAMLGVAGSALGALLARTRRVREGRPLPGYAVWATVAGVLSATAGIATAVG